jgi:FKBP-type peptidyl-prolyl cis-trans isomerase
MSVMTRSGISIILCFFLLTASSLYAQDSAEALETLQEKENYSIGYRIGLSMKTDEVEVDLEKIIQGFQDGLNGKKPRLDEEEMKKLITDLTERAQRDRMRKFQEKIVKNAEESQKFLEENRKKEGIRTTESGLQYVVLEEGSGASPGVEDFVTVQYRGNFIDGTEFDSSYAKGEPQKVKTDGVIKGWTESLQMMKVGSKWKIFLPPDLAYGRRGQGEWIPPNKVLVFEIELLSVESKGGES